MENLDAIELSRKLREETGKKLNNLSRQEKLNLFREIKTKYEEKIERNNILTKTGAYVPKVGIANYPSGVRDYSSVDGEEYIESLEKLLLKSTTDKELFTNIFKNWLLFSSNKKNFKTINPS